ncbi:hypothetical protein MPER_11674, partial [Moniliophthora perniciosa FA553]
PPGCVRVLAYASIPPVLGVSSPHRAVVLSIFVCELGNNLQFMACALVIAAHHRGQKSFKLSVASMQCAGQTCHWSVYEASCRYTDLCNGSKFFPFGAVT